MGDQHRSVTIERDAKGTYTARNGRGATLTFSAAGGAGFTPVELFLVGIAGCTGADVDYITAKRAEPDVFRLRIDAEKVRDEDGNRLEDIRVTFTVEFPEGEAGDDARAVLPDAVRRSHDRLCTVTRTIERGTPVESVIV